MTKNYEVFYIWISTDHLFNIFINVCPCEWASRRGDIVDAAKKEAFLERERNANSENSVEFVGYVEAWAQFSGRRIQSGLSVGACSVVSSVWIFMTPWTLAHHVPLSMGFPGKNTGVGFPPPRDLSFPPGDHPNPGIEPVSPAFPAL